jgi:RNA polymerase sigma-70 factor, ECF subfamily
MNSDSPKQITQLLRRWGSGDREAIESVMPLVYDELRRLARRYMSRERPDHTLQPSALVNEAYMKLAGQRNAFWQNRAQFYGVAAQIMRRILVDHARNRKALKCGGDPVRVSLTEVEASSGGQAVEVLLLDEALTKLEGLDPQLCRVVELRFFAGLTIPETAAALNISVDMVKREWNSAKAWLHRQLAAG